MAHGPAHALCSSLLGERLHKVWEQARAAIRLFALVSLHMCSARAKASARLVAGGDEEAQHAGVRGVYIPLLKRRLRTETCQPASPTVSFATVRGDTVHVLLQHDYVL